MELDLKEFGATLAVGVFVVFAVLTFLYTFFNCSVPAKVEKRVRRRPLSGKVAVNLVLVGGVFISGIVGEDLSNKYVDSDPSGWFLKKESELRREVLFDSNDPGLARGLAASGRLSLLLNDRQTRINAVRIENSILQGRGFGPKELLSGVANAVYYIAKNTVFGIDAYGRELAAIQTRIDFARNLAMCAIAFFAAGIVLFAVQTLLSTAIPAVVPDRWLCKALSFSKKLPPHPELFQIKILRFLTLQAAFLLAFGAGKLAFEAEEREFNKRVFGYFATLSQDALPKLDSTRLSLPLAVEISGLATVSSNLALCVHDTKANTGSAGPRLGLINGSVVGGGYQPIHIDWPDNEEANDLEAACVIPGYPDEYLVAESGYYPAEGPRFGRLFRIHVKPTPNGPSGRILQTWRWPSNTADVEGIVCGNVRGRPLLVAAERNGVLHWTFLTLSEGMDNSRNQTRIEFLGRKTLPATWLTGFKRKITDLHLDSAGAVWACAAVDSADQNEFSNSGPFNSVVYRLGHIISNPASPVDLVSGISDYYVLDGLKVEGLTTSILPTGRFLVGSDDEELGGVWRVIGNP